MRRALRALGLMADGIAPALALAAAWPALSRRGASAAEVDPYAAPQATDPGLLAIHEAIRRAGLPG